MTDNLIDRVLAAASHGALKRDPQRAAGKAAHNQARFLLNAVIEADRKAGQPSNRTPEELLHAALFLAKGMK